MYILMTFTAVKKMFGLQWEKRVWLNRTQTHVCSLIQLGRLTTWMVVWLWLLYVYFCHNSTMKVVPGFWKLAYSAAELGFLLPYSFGYFSYLGWLLLPYYFSWLGWFLLPYYFSFFSCLGWFLLPYYFFFFFLLRMIPSSLLFLFFFLLRI